MMRQKYAPTFDKAVLLAGPRPIKKGQLLKDGYATSQEFELSFDLTAHSLPTQAGKQSSQRSIIRFTTTSNNMNGCGDRMPMINFWPGTRLYVVMGRPGCHNAICSAPEDWQLAVGKPTRITVSLVGSDLRILQDGEELCRTPGFTSRYPPESNVKVWIGDNFYDPADATIANIVYKPASASSASGSQAVAAPWWKVNLPSVDVQQPAWWTAWPLQGRAERLAVDKTVREAVQKLIDSTWKDVSTRDREYKKVHHFEVVNVLRNENRLLWERYCRSKAGIGRCKITSGDAKTSRLEDANLPACFGDLDSVTNEFLLFHGTNPTAAGLICDGGFQISKAGSNKGTLYGNGLYFAENSSKSDEYAGDDKEGVYQGLFAMMLCRVCCGNMFVTDEVQPNVENLERNCLQPGAKHHCVVGDREKARGTYREFVVFDADQAYPEFVIIYRRTDA